MTDFIVEVIAAGGYLGIAFLMFLENVFPPVPSEVIMGFGGIAVAKGHMALAPLIASGTAGTVLGNWVWYWIGRWYGLQRLHPFIDRWGRWLTLDWEDVQKLDRIFKRYGGGIIFAFRFMPAFRTMVSLPAGLARMPQWKFLIWTAAGSAIWNTALALAGYWLGRGFQQIDAYLGPVAVATMVMVALVYFYRVITWRPRQR